MNGEMRRLIHHGEIDPHELNPEGSMRNIKVKRLFT